jgi:hypothetical protein
MVYIFTNLPMMSRPMQLQESLGDAQTTREVKPGADIFIDILLPSNRDHTECQQNKTHTSKPTGPLHPLPVPDQHFDIVALDFIGPLPEEDGKDTILTMTDILGANFWLAGAHSKYTAAEVAVVLFDEWYCENGLMLQLISDHDALFTSDLWTALHKLTGVKLKMSTAYHPETDGAGEQNK